MISTIRPETTIDFGSLTLTGILEFDAGDCCLVLYTDEGPEPISTDLSYYGYLPDFGSVFIKDWSEHSGLAQRMADAGLVEITRTLELSPMGPGGHRVRAHEVIVL